MSNSVRVKDSNKKIGDVVATASVKEVSQLHKPDVFRPVRWSEFSKDEKKKATKSLKKREKDL